MMSLTIRRDHELNVNIQTTSHGIEWVMPNHFRQKGLWSDRGYIFVCLSLAGCVLLIPLFKATWNHTTVSPWINLSLLFWAIFERQTVHSLFEKEHLVFSHGTLTINRTCFGFKSGKDTHYALQQISNIRVAPEPSAEAGRLLFEHDEQTISCCQQVKKRDMTELATMFRDILRFQCDSVECIVFGTSSHLEEPPSTTLRNPDVSTLTVPFAHLKHIIIETGTYHFHHVERFFTYAVNYIGQEYLKTHVTVHLYGEQDALHPNIRNSLNNLCRRVHVHTSPKEACIQNE